MNVDVITLSYFMKTDCPSCSKVLKYEAKHFGKRVKCPRCGGQFEIPDGMPTVPPALPVVEIVETQDADSSNSLPPRPENNYLHDGDFVRIDMDGNADFYVDNPKQAKHAIKEIRFVKRQIRILLKETNAELREIRHEYTDYTRRRLPMMRGGGKLGKLARVVQTASRHLNKNELASKIEPVHEHKEYLERVINKLDQHVLSIEALLLRFNA